MNWRATWTTRWSVPMNWKTNPDLSRGTRSTRSKTHSKEPKIRSTRWRTRRIEFPKIHTCFHLLWVVTTEWRDGRHRDVTPRQHVEIRSNRAPLLAEERIRIFCVWCARGS